MPGTFLTQADFLTIAAARDYRYNYLAKLRAIQAIYEKHLPTEGDATDRKHYKSLCATIRQVEKSAF